jgi:signal transduction histidine kinase
MSHELRTPVSSIVGFVELLSSSELSPAQRKEAIYKATAQSLLGLIGKILIWIRLSLVNTRLFLNGRISRSSLNCSANFSML